MPLTYDFWEGMATHLAQPEGFVLLGSYLTSVRAIARQPTMARQPMARQPIAAVQTR